MTRLQEIMKTKPLSEERFAVLRKSYEDVHSSFLMPSTLKADLLPAIRQLDTEWKREKRLVEAIKKFRDNKWMDENDELHKVMREYGEWL